MSASSDLLWQIVRKTNKFVVRKGGVTLSKEPLNLLNAHAQKYSGLVNDKAVGVHSSKKGVVLKTKKTSAKNSLAVSTKLFKRLPTKIMTGLRRKLAGRYYRPDLTRAALARATKLHKAKFAKKAEKAEAE